MITFLPSGERVLVELAKAEKQTAAGIYIPENAKEEKPVVGTIVAVGSGKRHLNEKVLFSRFGAEDLEIDGTRYCIVSEQAILGNFTE